MYSGSSSSDGCRFPFPVLHNCWYPCRTSLPRNLHLRIWLVVMLRVLHSAISAHFVRSGHALLPLTLALATLAPQLHATPQTAGPSPGTDDTTPTIHTGNETFPIAFVAHDKKKRAVLNLTPSDLSVSDNGTPVQLANLHLVTPQNGAAASVVLLFDHLAPESSKTARAYVAKLLTMAPGTCNFAVFGIDRGLRLFSAYTADHAALSAAVDSALIPAPEQQLTLAEQQIIAITQSGSLPSGAHVAVDERAQAKLLTSTLEDSQKIVQDHRAPAALAGMLALARAQQGRDGRKIIVFFTEGMRNNSTMSSAAQEVVEAANRSGVSIYPVDTNGVDAKSFDMLTMMYQPSGGIPIRLTPGVAGITVAPDLSRIEAMQSTTQDAYSVSTLQQENSHPDRDTLTILGEGTGGFVISGGDRMKDPLKRLVGDVSTYYEAEYTPNLNTFDGRFHPLNLQSVRPGLILRSGAGYFALPPDAADVATVRPFEAPLFKLLDGAASPTDIGFQQSVLFMSAGAGTSSDELVVEVPTANLDLRKDQETKLYSERVSILAEVKDKSGVVVERFSQDFAHNGALETIDAARQGHVQLQRHFSASPGDYTLETAVLDKNGAKSGVQHTSFSILVQKTGPWISDITLVKRTEPYAGSPDLLDPMRYGKLRVVPSLAAQIPSGTENISFFFVTAPDSSSTVPGQLDLSILHDDKEVSHAAIPLTDKPGTAQSAHLATIQSARLNPGLYHAQLHYTQGTASSSRELSFLVIGTGSGPANTDDDNNDAGSTADVPSDLDSGDGRYTANAPSPDLHAPSDKFRDALLAGARERALGYLDSLMNFKCIEVTDRFVDRKGSGTWLHRDKIAELVTYENHEESRKVLEVNGNPDNTQPANLKSARLEGEFGGVLEIVFEPAAMANFTWKESGTLDGAAVQVFSYHVDAKNSKFSVTPLPESPKIVPFHGLVFIDAATRGVRRVTMEAEDIPADSPVHASALSIDYDYVTINNHDYLMPVRGDLRMQLGKTEKIQHRIEFRDYHRFGSEVRIVGVQH